MHVNALVAAVAIFASPIWAATVRIPLTVAPIGAKDVLVRVVAARVGAPDGDSRNMEARAPGVTTLDLRAGTWRIAVDAPAYVRTERVVTVSAEDATVPLLLWPAAMVEGTVHQTKEAAHISALTIRWSPSSPSAPNAPPAGADECLMEDSGAFRCKVPIGQIDYNLHARGFASVFRWADDVRAAGLRIGEQQFVSGGSLVGRVHVISRTKVRGPVRVALKPVELGFRPADEAGRLAALRNRDTAVSKAGFFQFEGLAPGRYRLSVTGSPLVSEATEVDIVGSAEAELRHPLLLADPKRLRVHISPVADASGRPWLVELASIDEEAQRRNTIGAVAAKNGLCEFPALLPGRYQVMVHQGVQAAWHSEIVDVATVEDVQITIDAVIVRGTVRLGDRPIRATLWFGGDKGSIRVPIRTDSAGQYVVRVPRMANDRWPEIDVIAEQPTLRRALSDVILTPADDGSYRLDLDLPARAIAGQVVDADGKPVGGMPVVLTSPMNRGRIADVLSDTSGGFTFDGLSSGNYSLRAQDGLRQSQIVSVSLRDDDRIQDVRLRVTDNDRMTAHVTTSTGPVIGARVWLMPENRQASVVAPTLTDIDGNAELQFRRDEPNVDIVVAAPPLPMTFFRTTARSGISLEVPLNRSGSPLNLAWPPGAVVGATLVLKHRGAMLPILLVTQWAGGVMSPREQTAVLSFSSVDPGEYTFCDPANARTCVTGTVLTGAPTLTLELPTRP